MEISNSSTHRRIAPGFTLPAVLVVSGALLILAIGALLVVGLERNTARSFVDRNRADFAVQAGLEDIRQLFKAETSNDHYLITESPRKQLNPDDTEVSPPPAPAPYLFIVQGVPGSGSNAQYRHVPLFSSKIAQNPITSGSIDEQTVDGQVIGQDSSTITFQTAPHLAPAKVSWVPVLDANGKMVSRYAYWVEDLQGKLEAKSVGNTDGANSAHKRFGWTAGDNSETARFPAPGINPFPSSILEDGRDARPPLNPVASYLLTPQAKVQDDPKLPDAFNQHLVAGRATLITPQSVLTAAKVVPPLDRDVALGSLLQPKAKTLEENFVASVMPYDEQPIVPYSAEISSGAQGTPKLNLNSLLAKERSSAVGEMASFIDAALPTFEDRKGGFPDDYLKTLAASALDYADADGEPTTSGSLTGSNSYRGIDAYPLLSEVIIRLNYLGRQTRNGRVVLLWTASVFVELWNHTNRPVKGSFSVSYENGFTLPAIGSGVAGIRFDAPRLMDNNIIAIHNLQKIGDRYWSGETKIELAPDTYKFFRPIQINYTIDIGRASDITQNQFTIDETFGASGISLRWNGVEVDRGEKFFRGTRPPQTNSFKLDTPEFLAKAHVMSHSYISGPIGANGSQDFRNNMGDVRQTLYLRADDYVIADNSYPGNVSINVRNIRNSTIYRNGQASELVYGRVLPSEWPDGGHDVEVPNLVAVPTSAGSSFNPAATSSYPDVPNSLEGTAPTYLSDRGRFYSATELGRIYDPIMFQPDYGNSDQKATSDLLDGTLKRKSFWPSAQPGGDLVSKHFGGGNTLRIGRPEHPRFQKFGAGNESTTFSSQNAARLLDLFHAGKSRSEAQSEREGNVVRVEGHVNLNTATRETLRALAGGSITMDPLLSIRTSNAHSASTKTATFNRRDVKVSAPTSQQEADRIAGAIIRGRPYMSPSEISIALTTNSKPAFGNKEILRESPEDGDKINWSDAAAEEVFARVYNSSTVRSRNFRVWVVGQAVAPTNVSSATPEVLSEVRRSFTVFADPGERRPDGSIDRSKSNLTILNENDF